MLNFPKVMSPYFKRTARSLALVFALVGSLSACSLVGTLYQNATSLAMLEIDSYLDLSTEQSQAGKLRTEALMVWHTREVLPLYVKQLRLIADKAQAGFSPAEVNETFDWTLGELRRVAQYASPQQLELLSSLSDKQISYFQKKLAKDNAKYRKQWLDATPEDALELRFDKLMTWVERIYGSFSTEQKKRIRSLSDARSFDPNAAYSERLARQTQLVELVKTVAKTPASQTAAAQTALTHFVSQLSKPSDYGAQNRKELSALIAAISQIATPQQRNQAKINLLDYANTFEGISRGR